MVEVAQSYEMVFNFKAFVMFAVKNYPNSGRKFLNMPMLVRKVLRLGQNRRICWSKHDDTPPPPNVDGFATSLFPTG